MLKIWKILRARKEQQSNKSLPRLDQGSLRILVASVFIFFGLCALAICTIIDSSTEELESAKLVQLQKIGDDYLAMASQKSLARASIIAEMPSVVKLFADNKRELLLEELKGVYATQVNKYGSGPAQFIKPPATSFLRLNNPEKFGDDLSFRPMILEAMADQAPIRGMSVSRSGPGLFGVAPIKDSNGKFLGAIEMSQSFEMLTETIKNAYGIESVVFFDEEILKNNATAIKQEIFSSNNRYGNFVKLASTNWDLISNLIHVSDIQSSKPIKPFTKDFNGGHYGVVVIPLYNPAGTKLGLLALFSDLSINQKVANTQMVYVWLICLFGAVIITGLLMTIVKGGILRPLAQLSEDFESLSNNQKPKKINLQDYRGPTQNLASAYQKIVQKFHSEER